MKLPALMSDTNNHSDSSIMMPLVSVVIPCYNQAHFLTEAVESVLRQTYARFEIIVVDDGSSDDSSAVAARYANVRCIRQANQGRCAARNAGVRESTGDYLVFLDADDRLLPNALEAGVKSLTAHDECAFVFGRYYHIAADGSPLPPPVQLPRAEKEHYRELLRTNYIEALGTVMFRRKSIEAVGGFNTSLTGAEDYDLYFRITRCFPVCSHNEVVAEYRRHDQNTTSNTRVMLRDTFAVMRAQRQYVKGNKLYEETYREGLRRWRNHWGDQFVTELRRQLRAGKWYQALRIVPIILRHYPRGCAVHLGRKLYCILFRVKSDFAA